MKSSLITLVVLVILTILSAVVSNYVTNYATTIILILAGLKFIGITYFFMDLIKAHIFWRIIIAAFVFVILTIILVIY
ncbi:cytochrome C oxidase subunit IV family protein [uncultured Winogradskyella sp.]|uniref:cytochrome C oxidase subunit IV family protein n=1 Tax=uncultured Winogradskyella sp. TaxID=395353 RepID=UPI0030DB505A|tara:strand:+ start:968 stop:1201 length:234 start_codon:yes stop_codon:yes gene_type:complete